MRWPYTPVPREGGDGADAGAQWIDQITDLAGYADILCTMVGYPDDLSCGPGRGRGTCRNEARQSPN